MKGIPSARPRVARFRGASGSSLARVTSTDASAPCSPSARASSRIRVVVAIPCGNPHERTKNATCNDIAGFEQGLYDAVACRLTLPVCDGIMGMWS